MQCTTRAKKSPASCDTYERTRAASSCSDSEQEVLRPQLTDTPPAREGQFEDVLQERQNSQLVLLRKESDALASGDHRIPRTMPSSAALPEKEFSPAARIEEEFPNVEVHFEDGFRELRGSQPSPPRSIVPVPLLGGFFTTLWRPLQRFIRKETRLRAFQVTRCSSPFLLTKTTILDSSLPTDGSLLLR